MISSQKACHFFIGINNNDRYIVVQKEINLLLLTIYYIRTKICEYFLVIIRKVVTGGRGKPKNLSVKIINSKKF